MSKPGLTAAALARWLGKRLLHYLRVALWVFAGAFAMSLAVFIWFLEDRPDLAVWHTADLDAEFTDRSDVKDFAAYLALEQRLFTQLDERVYAKVDAAGPGSINRYAGGSQSDPRSWTPDWNRSFELAADKPSANVLLLHGMSDSPYSLRALGMSLNEAGARVIGLRLPGHGTAPSGLVELRWQSMAAAVRLAVRHLAETSPGVPVHLVGYSNGGALAVHYVLSAIDDSSLPAIASVVLLSPAIGVTPAAVFAVWQARLGHLLELEKLAWNSILPEYDAYKFNSFAVNAGDQVYRITAEIQSLIDEMSADGRLERVPPLLAFSSAVDATVSVHALVDGLFERLPEGGHELVVFDINRRADIEPLMVEDTDKHASALLQRPDLGFGFTLLSNEDAHSSRLVVERRTPGAASASRSPTGLAWPDDIYSLAHVALPFPWDDHHYGRDPVDGPGLKLGRVALRGERGVMQIPASEVLRLRSNPFYPYVEERIIRFLGLSRAPTVDP